MNERFAKHVNISSQRPVIFDTRVVAIFEGEEEIFQKVHTLVGLKTENIRTSVGRILTNGNDRWQTGHPHPILSARCGAGMYGSDCVQTVFLFRAVEFHFHRKDYPIANFYVLIFPENTSYPFSAHHSL